jgi:flagellar basal-body rod protein FlgB
MDLKFNRQQLIASNVANVDTPGYKGKDLKFQRVLKDQLEDLDLKTSKPGHLSDSIDNHSMGEILEDENPGRPDGNNVNIDNEMMKLTKNNIQYNIDIQFIKKKLDGIRRIIEDAAR